MLRVELDADSIKPLVELAVSEALGHAVNLPDDRLAYGEREAAERLGVPVSVLRIARADGELSASKLGRRVVYERAELIRWLAASRLDR